MQLTGSSFLMSSDLSISILRRKRYQSRSVFWVFLKLQGKDAASLETAIINQLEADGINFADCRSQCYDNASVMSWPFQWSTKNACYIENPLAVFFNCDNHSLNLVGVNAVSAEEELVTFFGIFQSLFAFFFVLYNSMGGNENLPTCNCQRRM